MIIDSRTDVNPYQHPAVHVVAAERRRQGLSRPSLFSRRLQAWTTVEQEERRSRLIFDLFEWHGRQFAESVVRS